MYKLLAIVFKRNWQLIEIETMWHTIIDLFNGNNNHICFGTFSDSIIFLSSSNNIFLTKETFIIFKILGGEHQKF